MIDCAGSRYKRAFAGRPGAPAHLALEYAVRAMTSFLTAFGLAGAAGLNAYVPVLVIAVLARLGVVHLAAPLDVLTQGWALALVSVLLVIELFVDKIPGVDHVNDIVQTVVRPAAGALAFAAGAGVVTDVPSWLPIVIGLVTAFSVHALKASARPAVNASTLGFGAPVVSAIEDVTALVTSVVAVFLPVFVALFVLAILVGLFALYRRKKRAALTASRNG